MYITLKQLTVEHLRQCKGKFKLIAITCVSAEKKNNKEKSEVITLEKAQRIITILKNSREQIHDISFWGFKFKLDAFDLIMQALAKQKGLASISLENCALDETHLELLLKLKWISQLKQLHLLGNHLKNASKQLCNFLVSAKNLELIDLSGNRLGEDFLFSLAEYVNQTHLKSIFLQESDPSTFSEVAFSKKACRKLSAAIAKNDKICELELSMPFVLTEEAQHKISKNRTVQRVRNPLIKPPSLGKLHSRLPRSDSKSTATTSLKPS